MFTYKLSQQILGTFKKIFTFLNVEIGKKFQQHQVFYLEDVSRCDPGVDKWESDHTEELVQQESLHELINLLKKHQFD